MIILWTKSVGAADTTRNSTYDGNECKEVEDRIKDLRNNKSGSNLIDKTKQRNR